MTTTSSHSSSLRRRPPVKLWKYILREFTLPLLCAIAAFCMLFLLNDVFDDISDFNATAIPAPLLIQYFLAKLPGNLANIIPISTLLATSFMTVNLGKNNELCAMRASGLSLGICAVPVWLIAALLCLTVFFIDEHLSARCAQFTENIRQEWLHKAKKDRIPQFFFNNPKAGRDWFFGSYHSQRHHRNGILRQYDENHRIQYILTARDIRYEQGKWHFTDGLEIHYRYSEAGLPYADQSHAFAEKILDLPESPEVMQLQRKDWSILNIPELFQILNGRMLSAGKARNHLKVIFWHRLTFPLASLISAFLGFALCIATGRSGIMKGFATAVFLLVFCYVSSQFFLVLGKNGWLPPFLAGAASNLFFAFLSVYLVWKKQ